MQLQGNDKSNWSGYTLSLGELAQNSGSYFKDMQEAFAASTQDERVLARASLNADWVQCRPGFPQESQSVGLVSCVLTHACGLSNRAGLHLPLPGRSIPYNVVR